jgi:hypothetical protein
LIKYVFVSVKDAWFVLNATARKTVVAEIVIGPEYSVDVAVGFDPLVVYRMVAVGSGHVIVTV